MNTGWVSTPIRALFARNEERERPDLPLLSVYRDHGVVARDSRDDNYNRPGQDLAAYKRVRRGDLVLNKMKTWQGSLAVSPHEGIVSPAYFVARPTSQNDGQFLHYLLRSKPLIAQYGARSKGIRPSQWDLPWDEFKEIRVDIPPVPAQRRIADFLDRESARIDALVEKKRRLIDLLEEKRMALITEAVTKGLDPSVPMKDSGVPWLGEVPAHWHRYRISHVFDVGSGTTPLSNIAEYFGGSTLWVVTGDLDDGPVQRTQKTVTEKALATYSALKLYPANTVIIAMYGATIGKLGWLTEPATVNQACCALSPRGRVRSQFAFYWLLGNRPHIVSMGVGGGQPNISQETVRALTIPTPDLGEQDRIAQDLGARTATLDSAVGKIAEQIDKLVEYREALVTTAVTGELDVDSFDSDRAVEEVAAG